MEELLSTEILDREILEDARKKAYRILKSADDTVKASLARWEKKTARALADIRQKYAARSLKTRDEIMARLPLDKRRARSEYIEGLLKSRMTAYFSALSRDRILALLKSELAGRAGELDAGPVTARFRGLGADEVTAVLAGISGDARSWEPEEDPLFGVPGTFPALTLVSRAVRIIVSVDAVMENLLQDRRAELVSALLGEDPEAPHD
jgi:hypothetical protein